MARKPPDPPGPTGTVWIPKVARKMRDRLEQLTGRRPDVQQVDEHLWRLSLENDRVRLVIDYRVDMVPGPGVWAASTLTVDGQPRALADNEQHFVRVFRDPDLYAYSSPCLFPMPPAADAEAAPVSIRHCYTTSRAKLPPDWGMDLGYDAGRNRWVMGITPPEAGQDGLRLFFAPDPFGWGLDHYRPLQVIRDGMDVSEQTGGDIAAAIALLVDAKIEAPLPSAGPPTQRARPTNSTTNSERVRKTTVIRV